MDNTEFTYEYFPHRNITKDTFKFFDVQTKIDAEGIPVSVGFKYPNEAFKVRLLDKKEFYSVGEISKAGLFGKDRFSSGSHKYVTITEGEYDALSLWQVLKTPVCSVQSSTTGRRDCALDYEWLQGFERIYLAFDNDDPGRKAAREVADLFDYNKVYHVKLTRFKDANAYLQAGEAEELRQIWWNAKKYLPDGLESSLAGFKRALRERPKRGLALYPSSILNEMTYGVRTSESVLITAMEGVGKTELMHAIEHKALMETDYAIGSIFLEEPKDRHLQALAGIQLRCPVHVPDCGVSDAEIDAALEKIIRVDDRLHIYSHFGSDDPDVLLDTIRFLVTARSCRFIFLDHIGMVVSGLGGEDERRALDYLSTRLEMMVKELDFGLILVSHLNDDYKTRGSRLISKNADVWIEIDRDVMSPDPIDRRTVDLRVRKNRPIGPTGPAGKLLYIPEECRYQEPTQETVQ